MTRSTLVLVAVALLALMLLGPADLMAKKPPKPPPEPPPAADPAIAYLSRVRDVTKLMVMNADGTNRTVVLDVGSGSISAPDWSPDGDQLVFCCDIQGPGVYVIDVDGTDLTKLIGLGTSIFGRPVWSPAVVPGVGGDRWRIAYQDRQPGEAHDLFLVDVDGSNRVPLMTTSAYNEAWPTWSPSGTKLAFKVYEVGNTNADDLWGLYDFSTGTYSQHRHAGAMRGSYANHPAWSKTREDTIAWLSGAAGLLDIWIVDLDVPGSPTQITDTDQIEERSVCWSPDDTKLVLSSAKLKGNTLRNHVIEVMDADGSNRRVIAEGDYKLVPHWRR